MKNKKISTGAIVGCVFISILLTIILFSVTNTLVANRVFTGKYISQTISNLFKADMKIELDGKEYDSISDGFYGVLEESINEIAKEDGEIAKVAKKEVEDFMEETDFEEFISDKLGTGMEAILAGEDVAILTEEDIVNFVDDNEKVIEETFDVEIDKEMLKELEEELEKANIEENLSTGAIVDELYNEETNPAAPMLGLLKTLISMPAIIAGYVAVLILFLFIFLLNKRQISFAAPYLGVPTIIVGVGEFVSSVTTKGILLMAGEEYAELLEAFVGPLSSLMLKVAIIYLVAGIAIVVASGIVKSSKKKNAMKEQSV